jgi:amino acid adenylation domain-containing protein
MSVSGEQDDRAARLQRAIAAKRAGAARSADIPRRPAGDTPWLGELQRGLWFTYHADPRSAAYNVCSAFEVHGRLNPARLQQAIDTVVARHRVLRSTFRADGDRVRQVIADDAAIRLERNQVDDDDVRRTAAAVAARPFDLERGPLVRAALIESRSGGDRLVLLTLHHIVADERAVEVLWREIADVYEGRPLPPDPLQYDDYVHWLQPSVEGSRAADLDYWRSKLDPLPGELRLPFESPPSPADISAAGALLVRSPRGEVRTGLFELAEGLGLTPFMAAAFAFRLLLHRYTAGGRVAFGTPVSTRAHPAAFEMVGYFLNALVITAPIDEAQSVREAIADFAEEVTAALARAAVPFDTLTAALAPPRAAGRHPLFQSMFVYQEAGPPPVLGEARLEPLTLDLGASKFDLTLFVTVREGALQTGIEYRSARFERHWMQAMLRHYECLVEELARDLDRPLAAVDLLGPEEAAQLAAWETGSALVAADSRPIPEQILERAPLQPRHPALVCGDERQDYQQFAATVTAVASALVSHGVRPGDRVAVFIDRSVQMIVALLGAQAAGAAYVPLDPAYPDARNQAILEDAAVAVVLTGTPILARVPQGPWRTLAVDSVDVNRTTAPLPGVPLDGPAYLLYTSGSTGRPKGVVVNHENLRLSTQARAAVYQEPPDRFLLLSSIAFDSSVAGIFWTLSTGGTLVVATDEDVHDGRRLARLIEEQRVTTMLCIPSLYAQLLQTGASSLRALHTVIVAGESCPSRLVAGHFTELPHVRLFNEYGPTEGTVWATVHELQAEDAKRPVPIGRPIPGVRIEVRDRLGRPVPAGIPGEASIVGATVADGYWRREHLSAGRFSNMGAGQDRSQRRYRTGDRMTWTPDGTLLFLGRDDEQLKVRGFRIEPGEIEAALLAHPGIEEAAVVARETGIAPGMTSEPALVGFVVLKQNASLEGWRTALSTRLPAHMIPARLVRQPTLPRLPNGKVDKARLRDLELPDETPVKASETLTTREEALMRLWQGLLGRYAFSPTDNFFELGGHSLLVIQLVAAIERDFEVRLSATDVFQHPTVRGLANRIDRQSAPGTFVYHQLFPIQPSGSGSPLVMASPDFFTEALAARFRGERPVYGIRGVSIRPEGNRGRWPTLTELAEEIVGELTRRFPAGPYVVAGYSFGGWLAIEIVRVLERRNLPVQRLYVIAPMPVDFVRVGPLRVRIDGLRQPVTELGMRDLLRHYVRSSHPLTRGPYRRARQWLFERPWRRSLSLLGSVRSRRGLPLTPRQMQADARVERFRLHAAYRPGPIHTPTEFFNPVGPASDAAATWRPYFKGPLTIHPIPDPHDDASVGAARDLVLARLENLGE